MIDIQLELFDGNYEVRCGMYNKAMKYMFQKRPTIKPRTLSQGKKIHKLMTEIGGGWYMKKITKDLFQPKTSTFYTRALI